MFTGIVRAVGRVLAVSPAAAGSRVLIGLGDLAGQVLRPGDSVAVNGACLTAIDPGGDRMAADVSPETLRVTTLGTLSAGSPVNLEPALTMAEPLGGHLVTGHVDGVGEVVALAAQGDTVLMRVALPEALRRYVARKGSLCVDGVSLTVNDVGGGEAFFTLVPHTVTHTIMQHYTTGTRVNLEVDLVARYVEKLLESR